MLRMRRFALTSPVFLFLLFHLLSGQTPVTIGTTHMLRSSVLKETRTYQVSLPASYGWAVDRSYPLLVLLDGETHFIPTSGTVRYLSTHGEIPEMIVVGVHSTIRIRDFTQTDWSSHWVGGGGAPKFKKFLSDELLPAIAKSYRTNGYRILSGHSASGQFVLYTLASEPQLFNGYIAISPSLNWDNQLPRRSLEESFTHRDSLRAFLYFAWSDDLGQALTDDLALKEVLQKRSPKGFRWSAQGYPDETHISIPLTAHIDAFRRLFASYRFHDDLLEKGFAFAQQHFAAVSDTVGYHIAVPEEIVNNFGYEALQKGNVPEALRYFLLNTAGNPNSASSFDGLADAYEAAQEWKKAIAAIDTAVSLARRYHDPNLSYFIEHASKVRKKAVQK